MTAVGTNELFKLVESGDFDTIKRLFEKENIKIDLRIRRTINGQPGGPSIVVFAIAKAYEAETSPDDRGTDISTPQRDLRLAILNILVTHGTNIDDCRALYAYEEGSLNFDRSHSYKRVTKEFDLLFDTLIQMKFSSEDVEATKVGKTTMSLKSQPNPYYPDTVFESTPFLVFRILVEAGRASLEKHRTLLRAVESEDIGVLDYVLSFKPNLYTNPTPLVMAIDVDWKEGAESLVEAGYLLTEKDAKEIMARGSDEMKDFLAGYVSWLKKIYAKRRPSTTNVLIRSMLISVKEGDAVSVQSKLSKNPALKNVRTGTGKTVQEYAESLGHSHIAQLLK